ncbi:unnamed protein product [Prorocentrum cordatum]|uniref:Uncharacterized protein n=1 Tax=Prorocentrum cordatum TaxID=2364126 RepID=A0ABN9XCI4_9DINO|nr:unnamed protein product [Polarella glacialis]
MGALATLRGGVAALFRPVPLGALWRAVGSEGGGAGVPLAFAAVSLVACRAHVPPAACRAISGCLAAALAPPGTLSRMALAGLAAAIPSFPAGAKRGHPSLDVREGPCRFDWCGAPDTQCSPGCSRPRTPGGRGCHRPRCPCRAHHNLPPAEALPSSSVPDAPAAPAGAAPEEPSSGATASSQAGLERPLKAQPAAEAPAPTARVNARGWHHPVNFAGLGDEMTALWGSTWGQNVQDVVVGAARSYVALRKLLELHKKSSDRYKPFSVDRCSVDTPGGAGGFFDFLQKKNPRKTYKHPLYDIPLPVSFLNSCLLLNLHCVDPVDDPVQQRVRGYILSCDASLGEKNYCATVLRAVLVVRAARHCECAACVEGKSLLSEADILGCFVAGRDNRDPSLVRRSTSEGFFFCGSKSECLLLVGGSSVLDALPGGDYADGFERSVDLLLRFLSDESAGDAALLDEIWNIYANFRGFGGLGNDADGWGSARVARDGHVAMYAAMKIRLEDVRLRCGDAAACLADVDCMVLQDNLCKLVGVLQTSTTGNLYGKGRGSALLARGVEKRAAAPAGDSGDESEPR